MLITDFEKECFEKAVNLALEADKQKNLPIGAVISLENKIIAEGKNTIYVPTLSLSRHAEMEALANIPENLKERTSEMVLYTTLEPCLMCFGAILLHQIGRILFGSIDDFGGVGKTKGTLPPYFANQLKAVDWVGPAYPEKCDPLNEKIIRWRGKAY